MEEDQVLYTENDIAGISSHGISLKNGECINFRECACHYEQIYGGSGTCVAERDITGPAPSFEFYTAPKSTRIVFLPKGRIRELFAKKNTEKRFRDLQKQILSFGFTTRDLS